MRTVKIRNLIIGDGIPKMCIPVMGEDTQKIIEETKAAVDAEADLIEWRVDFLNNLSDEDGLNRILHKIRNEASDCAIIFTFRNLQEGGNAAIGINHYREMICKAARSGFADLVDVEINRKQDGLLIEETIDEIHRSGSYVILSKHDFQKTPSEQEMEEFIRIGNESPADIIKLAVMPNSMEDVLSLLSVTSKCSQEDDMKPLITMSMGAKGSISRVCGEYFGSAVTFAATGRASAPGQLEAEKLKNVLNVFHKALQE